MDQDISTSLSPGEMGWKPPYSQYFSRVVRALYFVVSPLLLFHRTRKPLATQASEPKAHQKDLGHSPLFPTLSVSILVK